MKIVFLDRDGVISVFTPDDYVKTWQEFRFIPGVLEGLKTLYSAGFKIIVISNQAGVNKGIFSQESLDDVTMRMCEILKTEGVEILRVYYCVHTPEENCNCRKPKAGLFEKANADFGPIDFPGTFFVGDSEIDMEAGKNAGAKTLLVLSGRTISEEKTKGWSARPDFIAKNLKEAADIIIKNTA